MTTIKIGGQVFDTTKEEDIKAYILYMHTHSMLWHKLNETQQKEVITEIVCGLNDITIRTLNTIKDMNKNES